MENTEVIIPIEKYDEMMKAVAALEIVRRLYDSQSYFQQDDAICMVLNVPRREIPDVK